MTAVTIQFQPNELGLETWYVNQFDTIIEAVPSTLNDEFKGKRIQSPSPIRKNVKPAISDQEGHVLEIVEVIVSDFTYATRNQPADLNT